MGQGIHLGDTQTLAFNGTESAPVYWVRYNVVQESKDGAFGGYGPGGLTGWATAISNAPTITGRFLRCSMFGYEPLNHFRDDYGYLKVHLRESEFYGGSLGGYTSQHWLTNCLLDRVSAGIAGGGAFPDGDRIFRNVTMHGGGFQLDRWSPGYGLVSMRDCSFDSVAIDTASDFIRTNPTYNDYDYNAYTNSSNPWPIGGAHDQPNVTFNWQIGTFGRFYLPYNSSLIDTGSVTADVPGLYHFTTQTAQTKEGNSTVDIGFHYVAVDPNEQPVDSDADGTPDYVEDTNGNGAADGSESPWGLSITSQPQNATVYVGDTALFTVGVAGVTPIGYQWKLNGADLTGETNATLALDNVQTNQTGNYSVLVTNWGGSVLSATASLTVTQSTAAFILGVNLNGTNVTIEANDWWSYQYATNHGLTVSNARPDSITLTGLTPTADLDSSNMLQTFVRTDRMPSFAIQDDQNPAYEYAWNLDAAYKNVTFVSNIPPGYLVGTNVGYLGWELDLTNASSYGPGDVEPSMIYYTYGPNADLDLAHYSRTNLNMINYIMNHRQGYSYCDVNNAMLAVTGWPIGGWTWWSGLNCTTNPAALETLTNAAYSYGTQFVPGPADTAAVFVKPGYWLNLPPLIIEITNKTAAFTLRQSITNGNYLVYLWAAENEESHLHSFDIKVQGTAVATNVDDQVSGHWIKYGPYTAAVTSGTLTIDVISPVKGDPMLMGFAIYGLSSSNAGPGVQILSPTNGELFAVSPTNILVVASATNNVDPVAFYSGTNLLGNGFAGTNGVYGFHWTNVMAGSHTITAIATNNAGATGSSDPVTVILNAMPVVSIVVPTNMQAYREVTNVTLVAGAWDREDGTNIEVAFYSRLCATNPIGIATNVGDTNFVFVWTNLHADVYPITAVATDTRGASTTSDLRLFEVTPTNPAPNVWITYPTNNSVFAPGSDLTITAAATNYPDVVTDVTFVVNGEIIGTDTNEPYSITKCCLKPGRYVLQAYAVDTLGASAISTQVVIMVADELPSGRGFWDPEFAREAATRCVDGGINMAYPFAFDRSSDGYVYVAGWWNVLRSATGTNWMQLDEPFVYGESDGWQSMLVDGTNVYIGGIPNFATNPYFDDSLPYGVYRWNWSGNHWEPLGDGLDDEYTASLAVVGGDLYIGGSFTSSGVISSQLDTNVQRIARFDAVNNTWRPVGNGITNGTVFAIAAIGSQIFVAGSFTNAGGDPAANYIARLSGNTWTNVGGGLLAPEGCLWPVKSMAVCDTNLFVGGEFTNAGGSIGARGIAMWDGARWHGLDGGPDVASGYFGDDAPYHVFTVSARGDRVFVGGEFANVISRADVIPANNIAMATWSEQSQRWTWSALDDGVWQADTHYGWVVGSLVDEGPSPNSYDVYVAGDFDRASGIACGTNSYGFARWRVGYPQPPGPPTVTITNPVTSTVLTSTNDPIEIDVIASSGYTNLQTYYPSAEIFVDGVSIGDWIASTDTNSFYGLWMTPTYGPHVIIAAVTDDAGLRGFSEPVVINVVDPNSTVKPTNDVFTVRLNNPATELDVLANDRSTADNPLRVLLAYRVRGNTGTASVNYDQHTVLYTPNLNAYGTDVFVYLVTDGVSTNTGYFTVTVLSPPSVDISVPADLSRFSTSAPPVGVTTYARDWDGSISNVVLLTNGVPYRTLTNSLNYSFTTNWIESASGFYTLQAIATDDAGLSATSAPVTIVLTNATPSPHGPVAIENVASTPGGGIDGATDVPALIRDGLFDLQGTASDPDGDPVSYAVLLFRPQDWEVVGDFSETLPHLRVSDAYADLTPGPLNPQHFHNGAVTNGDLGRLDFTGVPNGTYYLVLRVRGGTDETNAFVLVQLESALKIGQFSFSEQDLVIPVSGIPLTVTRTYNSMNQESGSFGYSWSYALGDMDVRLDETRRTVKIGSNEALFADIEEDENGLPLNVSVRTGGSWDVTLTLPNGRRATFPFTIIPPSLGWSDDAYAHGMWLSPPGVNAQLIPLRLNSDRISLVPGLDPFWADSDMTWGDAPLENNDFPGWILTNRDGTQYIIGRGTENNVVYQDPDHLGNPVNARVFGPPRLTDIVERSGDRIHIDTNGISHYDATNGLTRAITFERDAAGRITAIYDPISHLSTNNPQPSVRYIYNRDTGNLIQVLKLVDRAAGTYVTNKYHYDNPNFPHYITSIENPGGVPVARNEYDDSGRLTAVVDADGKRTEFIHSVSNSLEVIVDRLGHTNRYFYDGHGNVTATTNALSQVTLMNYDGFDNKTNDIVFLNDQPYATNNYAYDTADPTMSHLLAASFNPLGFSNTYQYNAYGQVTASVDARGFGTANTYDDHGNLTTTVDALGHGVTNSYDSRGLLISSADALGTQSLNYYDSWGNLTGSATFAADGVTVLSTNTFGYDDNGNRTNSTVWRKVKGSWVGAPTAFVYDAQNRVVQTIDPDGGTNTVVFNEIGKQAATIDKLGRTNSYEYDFQGRLIVTTYPDGTSETNIYDPAGNRINSVDRAGRATTYHYDELNRLDYTVYPDGTTNRTVYDDLGRVAYTVDARGTTNAFGYDVAGRRFAVTNAWGASVAMTNLYGFDEDGNQITFTNNLGRVTTNVFDALGRQVQVQYADGTASSTGYDELGRRVAETNQDGVVTRFAYDGAGRLTFVTNALNGVTRYEYDEAGNLLRQIDALNRTTSFEYDSLGRRTKRILPNNQTETLGYDLAGNLIRQTNFNGVVITNQYDVLNRLTNRTSIGGYQVSYAYSPTGQRTNMTDVSGAYGYTYDSRDRLITNSTPAGTLIYGYDANANLTDITSSTSGGTSVTYQYDPLNRLTNVIDARLSGTQNTTYRFDGVGNLQSYTYPSGVTNLYQYDALNRLTNITWKITTTPLAGFSYALMAGGTRTGLVESVNTFSITNSWTYDPLYRLTNEVVLGNSTFNGTNAYTYDAVGNRLTRGVTGLTTSITNQTFSFDKSDRLDNDTDPSTASTWFDPNGNTTNYGSTFQYDVENRLISCSNASGVVSMVYNGDGQRVSKTASGTTTLFLVDTHNPSGYAQVLEELTVSAGVTNLAAAYSYGLDLISWRRPGTSTNFYAYDGNGNARLLLTPSGGVFATYVYDAYGNLLNGGAPQNKYRYAGEQFDPNLGMYYLRSRYYHTDSGRFWTMDTLDGFRSDPLSFHKYVYCRSNPVMGLDPSGHMDLFGFGETFVAGLISPFLPIVIQYQRGAYGNPTKTQLPDPDDPELEANDNSAFIVNSQKSVDAIFDEVRHLKVGTSIAAPDPADLPVSAVGDSIKWTPGSLKMAAGQIPFYVTVNKFVDKSGQEDESDHFFSVVTMGGHPLSGWRFWRVFRASGGIVVQTGAVDKPARFVPGLGNAVFGARNDVLQLWSTLIRDALDYSQGTRGSGEFDLVNGEFSEDHLQEFLRLVR